MHTTNHRHGTLRADEATRSEHPAPRALASLLAQAGVRVDGDAPWDIQVHSSDVYAMTLARGALGFGEAYVQGAWDCEELDELLCRILRADLTRRVRLLTPLRSMAAFLQAALTNPQSTARAFQVGERHYDLSNDLFKAMLDSTMTYSCGYWADASDLESAQRNKLDLVCRKLQLQPGERLLDIGCGWGSLAEHAARNYGVEVLGITVSREQHTLAQARSRHLPIEYRLMDYRKLEGTYEKIASVGMFEHVGPKNHPAFFEVCKRLLAPDGLFVLHTIGNSVADTAIDPWLNKYIFPNAALPSAVHLTRALQDRFLLQDWHNFGPDYDLTLMSWWGRFQRAWPDLAHHYDQRFYRMWRYYLMSCAAFFRTRRGQLWQLVLSHRDREPVYRSIR